MRRHGPVDRGLPLGLVGDVEMDIGGLAAGLADLGHDGLAFLVENVGHDHRLGALARRTGVRWPHPCRWRRR